MSSENSDNSPTKDEATSKKEVKSTENNGGISGSQDENVGSNPDATDNNASTDASEQDSNDSSEDEDSDDSTESEDLSLNDKTLDLKKFEKTWLRFEHGFRVGKLNRNQHFETLINISRNQNRFIFESCYGRAGRHT